LDQQVLGYIRPGSGVEQIRTIQEATLNSLFDYARMQRLIESNATNPKAYSLEELFSGVQKGVWAELSTKKPIDNFRRNLQKVFVEKMNALINPTGAASNQQVGFSSPFFPASPASPEADPKKSDVISLARGHLNELKNQITVALPLYSDKMSRYHLQDVLARINQALDPKK
jgi:uncharacterized protein YqcC (DUF446 family)